MAEGKQQVSVLQKCDKHLNHMWIAGFSTSASPLREPAWQMCRQYTFRRNSCQSHPLPGVSIFLSGSLLLELIKKYINIYKRSVLISIADLMMNIQKAVLILCPSFWQSHLILSVCLLTLMGRNSASAFFQSNFGISPPH